MKITPDSIKVIFFDIDYTLYIKNEARIPTSIIEEVLPRLKAKGIIPAIATGRNVGGFPKALLPYLNEEGFQLLVTINGQDNLYRDQQISAYGLSTERITQVIEKLQQLGIKYAFVSREAIAVSADDAIVKEATTPITADYLLFKAQRCTNVSLL